MTTAHQAIATAVGDALRAAPALAGGRVFANRMRPLQSGENTFVVLRLERATSQIVVIGQHDWATFLSVECYARAASGTDPAAAVDQLLQDTWARLAAIQPADIGAMSVALEPVIDWQADEEDGSYVCATVRVVVEHRTSIASLN